MNEMLNGTKLENEVEPENIRPQSIEEYIGKTKFKNIHQSC